MWYKRRQAELGAVAGAAPERTEASVFAIPLTFGAEIFFKKGVGSGELVW